MDQSAGYIDGVEQLATGAKQLSGLTGIGQVYARIVNLNNAVSGVNTEGTLQNGTAALKQISNRFRIRYLPYRIPPVQKA